jgi:hypothetical protein
MAVWRIGRDRSGGPFADSRSRWRWQFRWSGCADSQDTSAPSSTTSTTGSLDAADLEIAEVNFGDLSVAGDPILRTLAEEDRSTWRRSDDRPGLEAEARSFLEDPSGPHVRVDEPPTTWVHPSGEIAVQYQITQDGEAEVATVLFAPPEV